MTILGRALSAIGLGPSTIRDSLEDQWSQVDLQDAESEMERTEATNQAFYELVARVAGGEKIDHKAVRKSLAHWHIPEEVYRAAVVRRLDRLRDAEIAKRFDQFETSLRDNEAKLRKAKSDHKDTIARLTAEADAKLAAAVAELTPLITQARDGRTAAEDAAARLRQSASDPPPELAERLATAQQRVDGLTITLRSLKPGPPNYPGRGEDVGKYRSVAERLRVYTGTPGYNPQQDEEIFKHLQAKLFPPEDQEAIDRVERELAEASDVLQKIESEIREFQLLV